MPNGTPGFIRKRNGRLAPFNAEKIAEAVFKAVKAVGGHDREKAEKTCRQVVSVLEVVYRDDRIPTVEEVQDLVERMLIENGYSDVAKNYIIYREQRAKIRDASAIFDEAIQMVDDYLGREDWRVNENSNMDYSLQGLNNYVSTRVTATYWMNSIYPAEIRQAHTNGDFHIHDTGQLSVYCCGWDLQDLLLRGFGGVSGKVESSPAKHLRTALGQVVNFFYTLQGEAAGAQAFANFDTLLAPFVRYDGLEYKEVKQALQEFVFNLNIPTRVGFQTPFTNLTMDLTPPEGLAEQHVVTGGEPREETYADFQHEMNMINRAFCEVMMDGDAKGRIFTFPIPTYNLSKEFDWDDEELQLLWKLTAKYGIPYFANFINSDMKPSDARSMCCRLRLDNRELRKRGGGLFGSNPLTGSIGVVTLNMPRIGYLSSTEKEFFARISELMELAKNSLEIKRKVLENFTDRCLYPYAKHYLEDIKKRTGTYWNNHFSTIGLIGLNEACINFLGEDISEKRSKDFAVRVLKFMREKILGYQTESDILYNLEATPGEGTTYRLARKDKQLHPNIVTSGEQEPFYTNSSQLPVDHSEDLFEVLKHQDDLQTLYTGGTVLHAFLGERIDDPEVCKRLVRKIAENFHLPYFTISPTFSVCPVHGYIAGEHHECPVLVDSNGEGEVVVLENTKGDSDRAAAL